MLTLKRRKIILTLTLSGVTLLVPSILLLNQPSNLTAYVNIYTTVAAAVSFMQSFAIIVSCIKHPPCRVHPWILLSTGVGLWTVAEVTWLLHFMMFGEAFPFSLADFMWIAGYPFLILGLWTFVRPFVKMLRATGFKVRRHLAWNVTVISLLIAFAAGLLVVKPIHEFKVEFPSAFYVVLDALLLLVASSSLSIFYPSTYAYLLTVITTSFALFAACDLLYMLARTYVFAPADLLYAYTYVILALGFYAYRKLSSPT
ncbi:MAG: hypothetical protein N3E41_08205 [Thermofilaceae archaeon]|nr:hypothetical protein [Thermofilaceae archaeon]